VSDAVKEALERAQRSARVVELVDRLSREVPAMAPGLGSGDVANACFMAAVGFAGATMDKPAVLVWLRHLLAALEQMPTTDV
jgi:hypothetical protein